MEIIVNDEKRFYDDTYSKALHRRRRGLKVFCIINLIANLIDIVLIIIFLDNRDIYPKLLVFPTIGGFIFILFTMMEYINSMNSNNGDIKYYRDYYPELWGKIYGHEYDRETFRIINEFISDEKNREDRIINDIYERGHNGRMIYLCINPISVLIGCWVLMIPIIIIYEIIKAI